MILVKTTSVSYIYFGEAKRLSGAYYFPLPVHLVFQQTLNKTRGITLIETPQIQELIVLNCINFLL